jgi:hypothetical protein
MRCEEIRNHLDDYVDGGLPPQQSSVVEEHLQRCLPCRRELSELRRLLEKARELPVSIEPERDLWPGIRRQLIPPIGRTSRWTRSGWRAQSAAWFLAAAALAILAVSLTLNTYREQTPARFADAGPTATGSRVEVAAWERELEKPTAALREMLEARRQELPAETIAAVEENLLIIEEAIQEIQLALEQNPDNRQLTFLLADRYQREIELLKRLSRV